MRVSEWNRLARAVVARRVELGMRTSVQLADAMGMSSRVLYDIENARRTSYSKGTVIVLERALGWEPGSVEAILDGGDPTPTRRVPLGTAEEHDQALPVWPGAGVHPLPAVLLPWRAQGPRCQGRAP